MPRAIILYEIDQSFGPNILADYYLKQDDKIPSIILKEFSEKHVKKGYSDVITRNDENRFYSVIVNHAGVIFEPFFHAISDICHYRPPD